MNANTRLPRPPWWHVLLLVLGGAIPVTVLAWLPGLSVCFAVAFLFDEGAGVTARLAGGHSDWNEALLFAAWFVLCVVALAAAIALWIAIVRYARGKRVGVRLRLLLFAGVACAGLASWMIHHLLWFAIPGSATALFLILASGRRWRESHCAGLDPIPW